MAETLRDLLLMRRMAISELARQSGLSRRAIQDLLQGRVKTPHINTCIKIGDALTLTPVRVNKAIQASYDDAQSH